MPDILSELRQFGIDAMIHDPLANAPEAVHEYGLKLASLDEYHRLDGLVVAVSHRHYTELGQSKILSMVRDGGVVADVKSMLDPAKMERGIRYWSL